MEEKKSSKGLIIGIIVVVVVGIFVWRYFSSKTAPSEQVGGEQGEQVARHRRLNFCGQPKAGTICQLGRAALSKKGFVAIHQEEAGSSGRYYRFRQSFEYGRVKNFSVTLNRKSVVGESVYAMIHWDNVNGTFNPAEDVAATDKAGNVVMAKFMISESASEPIEYKL